MNFVEIAAKLPKRTKELAGLIRGAVHLCTREDGTEFIRLQREDKTFFYCDALQVQFCCNAVASFYHEGSYLLEGPFDPCKLRDPQYALHYFAHKAWSKIKADKDLDVLYAIVNEKAIELDDGHQVKRNNSNTFSLFLSEEDLRSVVSHHYRDKLVERIRRKLCKFFVLEQAQAYTDKFCSIQRDPPLVSEVDYVRGVVLAIVRVWGDDKQYASYKEDCDEESLDIYSFYRPILWKIYHRDKNALENDPFKILLTAKEYFKECVDSIENLHYQPIGNSPRTVNNWEDDNDNEGNAMFVTPMWQCGPYLDPTPDFGPQNEWFREILFMALRLLKTYLEKIGYHLTMYEIRLAVTASILIMLKFERRDDAERVVEFLQRTTGLFYRDLLLRETEMIEALGWKINFSRDPYSFDDFVRPLFMST